MTASPFRAVGVHVLTVLALLVIAGTGLGQDALFQAASRGDVAAVSAALKNGSPIDARNEKGWTPLIAAISEGQSQAALLLIDQGSDVNACTKSGYTPLHFAAGCGNPTVTRALLAHGARLDAAANEFHNTPLNMAVRGGSAKVIQLFLDGKADLNAPQDTQGNTPLLLAANRGLDAIVRMLLAAGADVNRTDNKGCTPLMAAALNGQLSTAKLLLENGADANRVENGSNALDYAERRERFRFEHFDIKELLYQAMTGKSRRQMLADFHEAIRKGDNATASRMLAEAPIYTDERSEALLVAAASGNDVLARELLGRGAYASHPNAANFTPLLYAAIRGDMPLVQLLLDQKADPNSANREGFTPLMAAARANSLSVVKLLLAANAEPSLRDFQGRTAIDFAPKGSEVATVLRNAGPTVEFSGFKHSLDEARPVEVLRNPSPAPREMVKKLALLPFTSADNSYASSQSGADLASLLQTEEMLKDLPWIERAELGKIQDELALSLANPSGSADMLRVGKWAGADIVVIGRFGLESGTGRQLTVEVVNVRNADVLARFSQTVKGALGKPLEFTPEDAAKIARSLAAALAESSAALEQPADKTVVAPLFFRNLSTGDDRLDFLEDEILTALQQTSDAHTRFLSFPGAATAADERDLALSGLVDRGDDVWKMVADLFVWGSFHEVKSSGVPFEKTKVQVDLEAWDGTTTPRKITGTFALKDMASALPSLVKQAIEHPAAPAPNVASRDVARTLLQRVKEMQSAETDQFEASKRSGPWLRRLGFRKKLLELARFFDPGDPELNRQLLVEKWFMNIPNENLGGSSTANPFEMQWRRCDAWGAYVDRFGLASLDEIPTDPITRNKMPSTVSTGQSADHPYQTAYVLLPYEFMKSILYHDSENGFPDDVPPEVIREWKERFQKEFLRRLRMVATQMPERFTSQAFQFFPSNDSENIIADPKVRAEVCSLVWKLGSGEKVTEESRRSMVQVLQRTMAAAGREGDTDALLAGPSSGPQVGDPGYRLSNPDREEEKRKIEARNAELLAHRDLQPGEVPAVFRAEQLKDADEQRCGSLEVLWLDEGILWTAVSARVPTDRFARQIWSYDPTTQKTRPYGALTETGSQSITSLLMHGADLWIGTDGGGAWRLDTKSNAITKFETSSGLPTPYLQTVAANERQIFFGGGDEHAGKIGVFDFERQQWTNLALSGESALPRPKVRRLAANADWLLVFSRGQYGADPAYFDLYDIRTHAWTNVPGLSFATIRYSPSLVADASGFWIGGGATLTHLAPPNEKNAAGAQAIDIPIEGEITALADDGEYLWIAASVLDHLPDHLWQCSTRIYRFHKSDRQISGFTRLPYNAPAAAISVAKESLWIGLDTRYNAPVNLLKMSKEPWISARP